MSKTIIFTGGHHNSALLVAKELKKKGYRILWLGHRHASKGDSGMSAEYRDVMAADISFIDLKSGKMHMGNLWQLLKTFTSLIFCSSLFIKEKPSLIVSFGGYLAFPPVLAAWLLRIPSISHEQTVVMGMANKAIFPFVKKMYLTWPIPKYQKYKKVQVIGLPQENKIQIISKAELNQRLVQLQNPMCFGNPEKPLIVVSGGKQGSHFINEMIEHNLLKLLPDWNILHQCGANLKTKDYQKMLRRKHRLPTELYNAYAVVDYLSDFQSALTCADIVIGRSGAHTVMEVLKLGKKMIATPLPFSYENEQYKNAKKLEDASLAMILSQEQANSTNLLNTIDKISQTPIDDKALSQIRSQIPDQALEKLLAEIELLLAKK